MSLKNRLIFIVFLHLFAINLPAQELPFVYMENGRFYEQCEEFYPLTCVYILDIIEDFDGQYHIAPHRQYCNLSNCWKGTFSCGKDSVEWNSGIRKHLDAISSMGFNTIRLNGLAIRGHYNDGTKIISELVSNLCIKQYNRTFPLCYKVQKTNRFKINSETFSMQSDLFENFLKIVEEHNNDFPGRSLRVILLVGVGGLQDHVQEYSSYLQYMGNRFRDNPLVLAYEINSEPFGLGNPKYEKGNKYEVANAFGNWYRNLKEAAPMHYITLGINQEDVLNWDAQVIPMDFINIHWYPDNSKPYDALELQKLNASLKWISGNFDKPWTIGEIGLWANDEVHLFNDRITTEIQQLKFARASLTLANWYGAIGYTWWQFKELSWQNDSLPGATGNFHGLVYRSDTNQNHKPAARAFQEFNLPQACDTCTGVSWSLYHNPNGYKTLKMTGKIEDPQGNPVANAFIRAKGKQSDLENGRLSTMHTLYQTYSDSSGTYQIWGKKEDTMYQVLATYPGMTVEVLRKLFWKNPPYDKVNLTIDSLDRDLLPLRERKKDTLIITKNEVWEWEGTVFVNERLIVVDKGATLHVTGHIYVRPGTKIVVNRGGKMIVDGGKIIGLCSWNGIEVWKTKDRPQESSEFQGALILKNEAEIINAEVKFRNRYLRKNRF